MLFSLSFSLQIALQHGLAVEYLLGNQKIGISNSSLKIYHSLDGVNPSELSGKKKEKRKMLDDHSAALSALYSL